MGAGTTKGECQASPLALPRRALSVKELPVAIVRGIAVVFDAGPGQCGAVEIAMEEGADVLKARALAGCDQRPAMVWLGQVGLCEDHVLRMWSELGRGS
jgi:hypothetical protein